MRERYQDGADGQNGTFLSSKCYPGYSGAFCSPCPVGTYKMDFSYGKCHPCQNKPELAYYWKEAEDSSICSYKCNSYIEKVENNPDCLEEVELDVQRLGGQRNFFILVLWFLIVTLTLLICLIYRHQLTLENFKSLSKEMYINWEPDAP